MQIYVSSDGKFMVTWRLNKTRCCYQRKNITTWDDGANRNAPNNTNVKKLRRLFQIISTSLIISNYFLQIVSTNAAMKHDKLARKFVDAEWLNSTRQLWMHYSYA